MDETELLTKAVRATARTMRYTGEWERGASYLAGDVVTWLGVQFLALKDVPAGVQPGTARAEGYWTTLGALLGGGAGPAGPTGPQGPQGPEGPAGGEAPPVTTRLDAVGGVPDVTYVGTADPGSLTSAAVWQIKKITEQLDGDITILFADGDDLYDNVWDDHLTLSYS